MFQAEGRTCTCDLEAKVLGFPGIEISTIWLLLRFGWGRRMRNVALKKKKRVLQQITAHASRAVGAIFWKGFYHKGKKESGTEFLAQEY